MIFMDYHFIELCNKNKKKYAKTVILLFSLVPSSHMIAPTRELVNTLFSSINKDSKFDLIVLDNYNIDMDINIPRGRTPSSINSSRVSLAHSYTYFLPYHERMTIQSNDPSWSNVICKSTCLEITSPQ